MLETSQSHLNCHTHMKEEKKEKKKHQQPQQPEQRQQQQQPLKVCSKMLRITIHNVSYLLLSIFFFQLTTHSLDSFSPFVVFMAAKELIAVIVYAIRNESGVLCFVCKRKRNWNVYACGCLLDVAQLSSALLVDCIVMLVCFFFFLFFLLFSFLSAHMSCVLSSPSFFIFLSFWIVMKSKSIYDYGYGIDIEISLVHLLFVSMCVAVVVVIFIFVSFFSFSSSSFSSIWSLFLAHVFGMCMVNNFCCVIFFVFDFSHKRYSIYFVDLVKEKLRRNK